MSRTTHYHPPNSTMNQRKKWFWVRLLVFTTLMQITLCGVGLLHAESIVGGNNAPSPEFLLNKGLEYMKNGAFELALPEFRNAADQFGAAANKGMQIEALLYLGEAYQSQGNHKLAFTALNTALDLAGELDNPSKTALVKSGLGNVCLFSRKARLGQSYLEESLDLAKKIGDHLIIATVLNNLGNMYYAQENYSKAVELYEACLDAAEKINNQRVKAEALVNLASVMSATNASSKAESLNDSAQTTVNNLSDSHNKAYLLITIGHTYNEISKHQPQSTRCLLTKTFEAYNMAVELAKRIDDKIALSYALGYMGHLYEIEDRYIEGAQLTKEAIFIAQEVQSSDALYRWQWQLGRLLKSQQKPYEAIGVYKQAIRSLQSIRHDLAIGYGNLNVNSSFRQTIGPIYFELADLLFQLADESDDPASIQDYLLEARHTVELLKTAELDDYFQGDCVNLNRTQTVHVDSLTGNFAVINVIPLPNRVEILLTLPSGLKRFHTTVTMDQLIGEVRKFRRHLETRISHHYIEPAKIIYDWIIRPIKNQLALEDIDTLVFVPDGALRTIPMSALYDGDQFLIEKYAVAVIPGMTLVNPKPIDKRQTMALIAGISESVQNFSALKYVPDELRAVQKNLGGDLLQDRTFNYENFKETINGSQYSIIHIASHGRFSKDAQETFLLTYDDKLSLDRLESLLQPGAYRGQPIELLTLSACETAAGDDRAALGLAGTAIKCGARSVFASLWLVNDEASTLLISNFYKNLQSASKPSKAKALQMSQQLLIKDKRFQHPRYWAPYIVIGNWM